MLHLTTVTPAPGRKLVPLMVSVKVAPVATVEVEPRLVMVGGSGLMVNVAPAELPFTLLTVTLIAAALAIRLAGTAAVN